MLQVLPTIVRPVAPAAETSPGREMLESERFILNLGRLLHRHGLPSDRLEEALLACSRQLGLAAQLFCTPTSLFASFEGESNPSTHLLRVEPGDVDLGRLSDLSELIDELLRGDLVLGTAAARLEAFDHHPPRWGRWSRLLSFGVASSSAACILGGSLDAAVVALGSGTLVGCLAMLAARRPALARVFEPVAAAAAAAVAVLFSPDGRGELATLASLIVLVPGFALTVGMSELAMRHLSAGTTRLAGALGSFLGIGFGVALGRGLGGALSSLSDWRELMPIALPAMEMPDGSLWLALVLAPLSFTVLFSARRRDAPWILGAGWLAWFGTQAGALLLGAQLAGFVGALAVGVGSNLLARHSTRPALVTLVPGILLLVPGSLGFRSVSFFLGHDTLSGVEAAFEMGLAAISIVAGLLLAHALVPPRRAL